MLEIRLTSGSECHVNTHVKRPYQGIKTIVYARRQVSRTAAAAIHAGVVVHFRIIPFVLCDRKGIVKTGIHTDSTEPCIVQRGYRWQIVSYGNICAPQEAAVLYIEGGVTRAVALCASAGCT